MLLSDMYELLIYPQTYEYCINGANKEAGFLSSKCISDALD